MTALLDSLPLSRKQVSFVAHSEARINIATGSIRSGKTVCSLVRWLIFVAQAPRHGELVMVGKTAQTLARNVFAVLQDPDLFGDLAAQVHYTPGAPTAVILGRRVHVIGANDAKAEPKVRGMTVCGAYVDEATLVPKDFWNQLLGRMSVPGAKLFATTNPDSPAHWLRRDFLLREGELNLRVWNFRLEGNKSLDPSYVAQLRTEYVGLWQRRFIEGAWVAAEGAVFDMWDEATHVVDILPMIRRWVGLGIDYGASNPTAAVLLGLGDDRRLYAAGEYRYDGRLRHRTQTQAETSQAIRDWLTDVPGHGRVHPPFVAVDPSAASFIEQLHRDRLSPVPADNSVLDSIRLLSNLLGRHQLLVHRSCTGLIEEIPGYSWDDRAALLGEDKPIKADDHSIDATRYIAMTTRTQWAHQLRTAA